jgi:CHASE2 domain-containing sensor protein
MAYRAVVFVITVLIAVVTGLLAGRGEREAAAANRLWPGPAELRAQDVLLRARLATKPHPDVLIVAADDASVRAYGPPPWSRERWARALNRVQAAGAKVAVFDVAFDRRTARDADRAFYRALAAHRRRGVLGMGFDANQGGRGWTPDDVRSLRFLEKFALTDKVTLRGAAATQFFAWPLFEPPVSDFTQNARGVGVFLRETDDDALIRHARLLYRSKVETPARITAPLPGSVPPSRLETFDVALPGLALSAARQAFGVDKTHLRVENDAVRIAGDLDPPVVIPLDAAGRMAIHFAGGAGSIPAVSLVDVVEGKVPAERFKNKVVFFGATASGAEATDLRRTPYGLMPRVEITANAVSSILSRSYLARARGNDVLATLIAAGIVAGLLLPQASRAATVLAAGLGLTLLYLLTAWCAVTFFRVLLPVLPVLLLLGLGTVCALACALVFEAQRRRATVGNAALR